MSNSSLAAQAIANGPMTAAPPSFNGHGWLLVIDLAIMTATALLALSAVVRIAVKLRSDRDRGPLVTLLRWLALIAIGGMWLRTGVEAINLWGWNPLEPVQTGWYMTLKRMIDPIGGACYFAAICMFTATEDALTSSLERRPYPERLTATLPKLVGPTALVVLFLIAAIGVVSLR